VFSPFFDMLVRAFANVWIQLAFRLNLSTICATQDISVISAYCRFSDTARITFSAFMANKSDTFCHFISATINLLSVADCQNENGNDVVLYVADDAIVANSYTARVLLDCP
jgi:hypothetical protein